MRSLIEPYLQDHETAWAASTLASERSRLNSLGEKLSLTPVALYEAIKDEFKAYTLKTIFVRLVSIESWGRSTGLTTSTQFADFMRKHRNLFKHAYQKEEIKIDFDTALKLIDGLENPYRDMARALLATGLRKSEAYSVRDGKVKGKGGKVRSVYGKIEMLAPSSTFSRKLKAVGLKPHTLRKLCATRLAEKGATPADLCKIFGWSSIATAYQYLQSKDDQRLMDMMGT